MQEGIGFFESWTAVEPITGLKDPKLAKLAKRVVEVREKSRVNTVKYHEEGLRVPEAAVPK